MIPIAREGLKEIVLATIILGAAAAGFGWLFWPASIPFVILWLWVLSFFRDPTRQSRFGRLELCSPADGTITEISQLEDHELLNGPAVRIGMFLSLLNVHINRAPCTGQVRRISYQAGRFLDARHPESGLRNESNSICIETDPPMPGPVIVRQVAGRVARRIVCHAKVDERLTVGERFGLIKFGSRTELIVPRLRGTELLVQVGDKVKAGLSVLVRQPGVSADMSRRCESAPPAKAELVP